MDGPFNFVATKRNKSSRHTIKSREGDVQLPPLNIRTNNEIENSQIPVSQGSQAISNNEVFQHVNVGMRSNRASNSKYSKYTSRMKRGHKSSERFNYFMRKVISSVDKPLVAPTTLGIQSIIIGSHPHKEENKDITADRINVLNRTRLEPLPNQTKTEQRLSSTLNQVLGNKDSSRTSKTENKNKLNRTETDEFNQWIQEGISKRSVLEEQSERDSENEEQLALENQQELDNISETRSKHEKDQIILPEYDNTTTQQVADLMHIANTSNRIFIAVKKDEDEEEDGPTGIYQEHFDPPMNHEGTTVFSKQGFIKVGKGRHQPSDYISHDNFILDGINRQIFSNLPLFKKFQLLKTFKQWKFNANYSRFLRKREVLCKNYIPSKPQFAQGYAYITEAINEIKNLKFLEIKKNAIFGRKQQSLLEKCEKVDIIQSQSDLKSILYRIKNVIVQIKNDIIKADQQLDNERRKAQELNILKQSKYDEHIVFTQAKKRRELEGEKLKIAQIRHKMFDQLIQYVNRYVASNLTEVLYENKKEFSKIFLDTSSSPQFELSV